MFQDTQTGPAPIGVVYNTSMSRADAALALAALYVTASRREARVDGICVTGSGFDAAVFCDIVARSYTGQGRASSNVVLPIGFAADDPSAASPAMVEATVNRTRADGQPQYPRGVRRTSDTAAPDALLRNAITLSAETVVVVSAPIAWFARSVALAGAAAQYRQRVRRVVIVEAGEADRDAAALHALVAALPVPVVLCGQDVGNALAVPRARLQGAFNWTPASPVADALGATDAAQVPLHDVAAIHYAVHPDSGFFTVAGSRLSLEPSRQAACQAELVALATSRQAAPPARGGVIAKFLA